MKLILVILTAITLNNAALFAHYKHADSVYVKCYQTVDDIEDCMKKDLMFRISGTILFTEGSYLE